MERRETFSMGAGPGPSRLRPTMSGTRDAPSRPGGAGRPTRSRRVGMRSTDRTIAGTRTPEGRRPGMETRKGTRVVALYTKYPKLSSPWSPSDSPWSASAATSVCGRRRRTPETRRPMSPSTSATSPS